MDFCIIEKILSKNNYNKDRRHGAILTHLDQDTPKNLMKLETLNTQLIDVGLKPSKK